MTSDKEKETQVKKNGMKPINWNETRTHIRTNLKEIKIRSISSKIAERPVRFNKKNTTES